MNKFHLLIALIVLVPIWLAILRRWQRGVYLLLLYIPVSGIPTLLTNYSPAAILFKDIAFIIPTYLSFFVFMRKRGSLSGIPRAFIVLLGIHVTLVIFHIFNPTVPNPMVGLIGAKVWLFYIPMFLVAHALISDRQELIKLLRPLVIASWIPPLVGIGQWIGSSMFGYARAMTFMYGDAAYSATQKFGQMHYGAAWYRIPSTFSFITQYVSFLWVALVLSYILAFTDSNRNWRLLARGTFALTVLAAFLSGSRGSFVVIPFFVGVMFGLQHGLRGGLKMFALMALCWIPAAVISGLDLIKVLSGAAFLLSYYSKNIFYGGIIEALDITWIGLGTGLNTIAARYGYAPGDAIVLPPIENYYAKAIVELGILGLLAMIGWQLVVMITALNFQRIAKSEELRGMGAALAAFFVFIPIHQFKGFALDIDPINIYFWVFVGFAFRLNSLLHAQQEAPLAPAMPQPQDFRPPGPRRARKQGTGTNI